MQLPNQFANLGSSLLRSEQGLSTLLCMGLCTAVASRLDRGIMWPTILPAQPRSPSMETKAEPVHLNVQLLNQIANMGSSLLRSEHGLRTLLCIILCTAMASRLDRGSMWPTILPAQPRSPLMETKAKPVLFECAAAQSDC